MTCRRITALLNCALLAVLVTAGGLSAELRFSGNARSMLFSRERLPVGIDQEAIRNFRHFQSFRLNLEQKNETGGLGFHTFFRVSDDLNHDYASDPNGRLYNGYLKWERNATSVSVGRQWLHAGPASMTLDGIKVTQSWDKGFDLTGFVGTETPFTRRFELNGWDETTSGGVYLRNSAFDKVSFGAGYQQKDRHGELAFREIGLDGTLDLPHGIDLLGRMDLNLLDDNVQRAVLRSRFRTGGRWGFMGEYRHYKPRLFDRSYFRRFDLKGNDQFRGGATFHLRPNVTLNAGYTGIFFDGDSDSYLTLGGACPWGSVVWYRGTGTGGDQDGITVSGSYILREVWELFADIDYSLYRWYEDTDRMYDFSSVFGLNWRPSRRMAAGLEFQNLNNDILSKDFRVLLKFALNHTGIF